MRILFVCGFYGTSVLHVSRRYIHQLYTMSFDFWVTSWDWFGNDYCDQCKVVVDSNLQVRVVFSKSL